jgi:hypothetical protein
MMNIAAPCSGGVGICKTSGYGPGPMPYRFECIVNESMADDFDCFDDVWIKLSVRAVDFLRRLGNTRDGDHQVGY